MILRTFVLLRNIDDCTWCGTVNTLFQRLRPGGSPLHAGARLHHAIMWFIDYGFDGAPRWVSVLQNELYDDHFLSSTYTGSPRTTLVKCRYEPVIESNSPPNDA